jgi:aminopeptidase YwaD
MKQFLLYLVLLTCPTLQSSYAQDPLSQAKGDVEKLSSSELSGRGYTFDGIQKAGRFLESRFKEIGVQPLSGEGYQQHFKIQLNTFPALPKLSINGEALVLGRDFLPHATSGSGSVNDGTPLFYVKSGLFIPEKKINDYAGVTMEKAILIMDEDVPESVKKDTSIDRGYLTKEIRIKIASQLHPAAIIFLVNRLSFGDPNAQEEVPVLDVQKEKMPAQVATIALKVKASYGDRESINIAGKLPGKSRSDSCILLCAHFDHLGAFSDSAYFPGANDNASGTAMLLSLAEYFKAHPINNSLLFLAVSGEEEGLLGSKYYAEHPLHDLNKTRFLLNFDIVGSGDGGIMVVGGENFPAEFDVMTALCDSLKIKTLWKRPTVPNSDQYYFSTKGVKTFYLYTLNGKQPYHRFDDIPGTLDWGAYMNVYRLATAFIEMESKTQGRGTGE